MNSLHDALCESEHIGVIDALGVLLELARAKRLEEPEELERAVAHVAALAQAFARVALLADAQHVLLSARANKPSVV